MAEQKIDQQQVLEQQKLQCPFCKIIKGDIPSKKIFEDDKLLAILDINPIKEGHVLLMPKEHYPIMPLIPPQTLERMFIMTRRLAEISRIVFEKSGTTIFIANGAVAGQQSAHFMLHIIPRDDGDGLDNFDVAEGPAHPAKHKELLEVLANNLPELLRERYAKYALKDAKGNVIKLERKQKRFTKSQVLQIIENNPQLKELILKQPNQFRESIDKSEQLKQLFTGLDVDEIILEVNPKYKKGAVLAEFKEEKEAEQPVEREEERKEETKAKPKKRKKEAREQAAPPANDADLDLISGMF